MSSLFPLDVQITYFLNQIIPHNRTFDALFSFLSLRGNSIVLWIGILVIAILLQKRKQSLISKRNVFFMSAFIISFFLTSLTNHFVLKNIFQRPRPYVYKIVKPLDCPKDYSFPSGHASSAFAAATVLSSFDKKRRWVYFLAAVLVSLSRIYLGCHYFFDAVGGAIVGYTISWMTLKLFSFRRR
ncbi:phosphatase PAP2 family protein [Candidatus Roizmanbacteria bacterium]|nr:phosphatase PAP2 family protein [Candidatus Roizmanbacteria bacterium]